MSENVILTEKQLSLRDKAIRKLLSPLTTQQSGPATRRQNISGGIVIAAHGGKTGSVTNYRDLRFPTFVKSHPAMYFEIWQAVNAEKSYYCLYRAYLSIYSIKISSPEKELLCLHCDPNEKPHDKHYLYKRGPHLHITSSEFPDAHIALNLTDIDKILSSMESLNVSLHIAVKLIKEQFLADLAKP